MIDLSQSIKEVKCHMHKLHLMADGEWVLYCRTESTDVRVSERALADLTRLSGRRVVLENGIGETWVMTADQICTEPDYVADGKHGPFWAVPFRAEEEEQEARDLKQIFGSHNPQLHTVQNRLPEGAALLITKDEVKLVEKE
jgi:hypothetical protein